MSITNLLLINVTVLYFVVPVPRMSPFEKFLSPNTQKIVTTNVNSVSTANISTVFSGSENIDPNKPYTPQTNRSE